jgi:hypothetical protein
VTHDDPVRARSVDCLLDDFWRDYCGGDREGEMIRNSPLPRITRAG